MKRAGRRRHVAAGIAVFACATVGGCNSNSNSNSDTAADPAAAAPARTSAQADAATAGTSELENWAISATSTGTPRPPRALSAQAVSAQASSDALAPPVIHTVD
ncbi:hypothetical protein [Caballeronia sp. AZ10_KS36]|uniref:hypothetical protein n=1 Tax=Caballeronia sp. AZ10_KS36 TaxID=2921757 RepID=UPI002028B9EC|nr:hypothetical protein [Caballeronia sp. AZ10_KS36]